MRLKPKTFQDDAARRITKYLTRAFEDHSDEHRRSAVLLKAPTGAGKTVIATDVVERLLNGSGETEGRPALRVLWITDSPSLNAQSAEKMDRYSDGLRVGRNLIVVDETYDQAELQPGSITFVNIGKLTSKATTYQANQAKNKQHTLWHTIARTVREHPDQFLLIVDEAHKSIGGETTTATSPAAEGDAVAAKDRLTIIRTLLDGGPNLVDRAAHPAVPVAFVMTATPDNFKKAVAGSERLIVEDSVAIKDVQNAGLLKRRVSVEIAGEKQKANHTLLATACEDLYQFEQWWQEATGYHPGGAVIPIMVIQVEDSISSGELAERVKTIRDAWGAKSKTPLDDAAFAHSFGGDPNDKTIGSGKLRYLSPELIDTDPHVRFVFFKKSLTTGWDCPRAEVMVSLRVAKDGTEIAQLVGRMVRMPGADGAPSELLEAVQLYLPFYDQNKVDAIVRYIAEETEGATEVVLHKVAVRRNPDVPDEVVAAIEALPRYAQPRLDFDNDVQRARVLAEALVDSGVVAPPADPDEAWETPRDVLRTKMLAVLTDVYNGYKAAIDERVADLRKLNTERFSYKYGIVEAGESTGTKDKTVHARDLEGYFAAANRSLPDATGQWYFEHLVKSRTAGPTAKALVAAIAGQPDIKEKLNAAAADHIISIRKLYNDRIERAGKSSDFEKIWNPPSAAVREPSFSLGTPGPVATQRARLDKATKAVNIEHLPVTVKHVFAFEDVSGGWVYPVNPNSWEIAAIDIEIDEHVIGWYRNPNSGRHALSVPYKGADGRVQLLHPDFIFVRRDIEDRVVVDIVDPHKDFGDALAKWRGLAAYAKDHADVVRRVIAVTRIGDTDWGLNLADPEVRDALTADDINLEALFRERGSERVKH